MGDHAGSHDHTADEEVKYVVNEDLEDSSWMHNTRTEDAGALNEGEFYDEEEEYYHEDGINCELEYSYTCDSSQQVAREGGTASRRSASTDHKDVLLDDESGSSKSSEEDEVKVKPKTKKKGVRGQFEHLQESPLDAHSDPGDGGRYETHHPELARSKSINLVTSWVRDATLGEHLKDSEKNPSQHAHSPPRRLPPPRCHRREAAHSSRRSISLPRPNHQCDSEAQYCDKTPAYDPSGYQCGDYEDHRVAIDDSSTDQLVLESIYRPEPRRLDKALKFMKIRAVGFVGVSRTAAVGLGNASKTAAIGFGNVSRTAAVGVKSKSIEFKNLAVPVLTPIFNAVLEESKDQLRGSEQGRGPVAPILGRGPGSGRAAMARPMQPWMRPDMPVGPRPVMRPVMRPGMRPVMRPGMRPVGMRPLMRPGMGPPGGHQPTAQRPNMMPAPPGAGTPAMVVPATRGHVVTMQGQPRSMGGARGQARPFLLQSAATPTDFSLNGYSTPILGRDTQNCPEHSYYY